MTNRPKDQGVPGWYRWSLLALWGFALVIRFWGLGRFNSFVFDEVYYVRFATNYLTQTPFFDGHPPLSKYLIAIGIWLGNLLPIGQDTTNSLAGLSMSTFSYRWFNALTGSLIPLVVAGLAYQISDRRSYALLAAFFVSLDGLFLVESRYALNNIYLVFFGLLGQWCWLRSLRHRRWQYWGWLLLAGINFGATIAIKWNGLWFLLGTYITWGMAWIIKRLQLPQRLPSKNDPFPSVLGSLTRVSAWQMLLFLGFVPFLTYALCWIPHLQLNPTPGFWQVQWEIYSYHQRVGGNTADIHPYCSPWISWIWMLRPVLYAYQSTQLPQEALPVYGPSLPSSAARLIYAVSAMGNPLLWWFSSLAILFFAGALMVDGWREIRRRAALVHWQGAIALFLVVNYAANWLPWARVSRCTFLYHYMGASIYSMMAIAWLVHQWLQIERPATSKDYKPYLRVLGIWVITLIVAGFIFWLPVYLGLPLTPSEWQWRRWLPTW